jgi:hypothetical protein
MLGKPVLRRMIVTVVAIVVAVSCFAVAYSEWGPTGRAFPWLPERTATVQVVVSDGSGQPMQGCSASVTPRKIRTPMTAVAEFTNDVGKISPKTVPLGETNIKVACAPEGSRVAVARHASKTINLDKEGSTRTVRITISE